MAGRGRGRGRGGFGRGQQFSSNDQLSSLAAEKAPSVPLTPYPTLEYYPAQLSTEKEYDDLLQIRDQLLMDFQTSKFHLKEEDENSVTAGKHSLNFNWDFFPLELRPIAKQRQKKKEIESRKKNPMDSVDLSWLDNLEKVENETDGVVATEGGDAPETNEEDEGEDFVDEDLDMDSDYLNPYFDTGEGDPDDNLDEDEDPTY